MSNFTEPKRIPIGVDNFSELVSPDSNFLFVDKSLLIKELVSSGAKLSLIIRPRRWGKTLNMSMIQYFFSREVNGQLTQGLFDNLKIANIQDGYYLNKYQGKYPVIFISFKNIKPDSWGAFIDSITTLIAKSYREYEKTIISSDRLSGSQKSIYNKMLNSENINQANLENSLQFLSECLYGHYNQKVVILIDEYDTPLNATHHKDFFDKIVNFFKNMFGAALKGNNALEFGVITGILRLSKNKMLSDLNNLKLYSFMDAKYSEFFGFSELELFDLFNANNINVDMEQLKHWYNGYKSGELENLYNPWSILNYIDDNCKFKAYWIKTGDEELLKTVLLNSGSQVKEKLNKLIIGESIESIIDEYLSFDQVKEGKDEVVWSLLWSMGYLKTVGEPILSGIRYKHQLKIPNYEVECNYRYIFTSFARSFNETKYDALLKNLVTGNIEDFIKDLENFMLTIPSFYDLTNETNYHMLLLAWSFSLNETHDIYSNKEAGLGRPDLVLSPRDPNNDLGMIIEFKKAELNKDLKFYNDLLDSGLKQIEQRQYDLVLKNSNHIKRILKLCLVFYGKQFKYKYKLNV
jgi:hypothetical protein